MRPSMPYIYTIHFFLLVPSGPHSLRMTGLFMLQRSDFSSAKIQGALGVALGPCVLFLALAGCLVGGLAVAGVGGCGCRRVRSFLVGVVGCLLACLLFSERTGFIRRLPSVRCAFWGPMGDGPCCLGGGVLLFFTPSSLPRRSPAPPYIPGFPPLFGPWAL